MTEVTDSPTAPDANSTVSDYRGWTIQTNFDYVAIKRVVKASECTATVCTIYNHLGVLKGTALFVEDTATFDNIILSLGNDYFIECWNNGSSYTMRYKDSVGIPQNKTNINFIQACKDHEDDGGSADRSTNILNIVSEIIPPATTHNEKEVKTDWPVEEGLTARTQKQTGRITNLIPQQSFVRKTDKEGIY